MTTDDYMRAWLTSDTAELESLASHQDRFVRVRVASNKHGSLSTLLHLSIDEDEAVRAAVASNSTASRDILERMWQSLQGQQREAGLVPVSLAENRETPEYILRALYDAHHWGVLIALANNSACPHDILESIAALPAQKTHNLKDKNAEVRAVALSRLTRRHSP